MPTNILMPALSPTMEEGTLAKWLKAEGDEISAGDVIAEIETDKATMEVEAVDEGRLGRILVAEGTEGVKVNAPIAVLLEEGEDASAIPVAENAAPGNDPGPEPSPPKAAEAAPAVVSPAPGAPAGANGARIFASPLARRIAAEKGLDLAAITGSGPHGRIVKRDVEGAVAAPKPAPAPSAPAGAALPVGPDLAGLMKTYEGQIAEEIPLDGMRKTIAARLTEAKQTVPHFYLRREIRIDDLLSFRKELNAKGAARGIKLSVNDFIIKAGALALEQMPSCNAIFAGDRLLRLAAPDVAVAVAVEGGLFTPVIRDAAGKSLASISAEMKDLAARARDRRLAPTDYQGGAFAISNLGMYGIDNFDAVINPPHASILAVGAGVEKPVISDGAVAAATVMSVTLSVDHRAIDGALGAEFLGAIAGFLEDPVAMVL
ncbi:MAG: pyruvate dehydrogenase complex dihydrolipoamide acetyltransferase [Pseudomonadota bacterium]